MRALTLLLFALFLLTSAGMVVIAKDFKPGYEDRCNGHKTTFSIMDLELPREEQNCTAQLVSLMPPGSRLAVLRHLDLDYLFMVGCYMGIMCLNLWVFFNGKDKGRSRGQSLLLLLCVLQVLAWALDIAENIAIGRWVSYRQIETHYAWFRIRTIAKFIIGITGFLVPLFIALVRRLTQKPAAAA